MRDVTRYQKFLILVFALVWIWAAISPVHPDDWLLENLLVLIFVPIILLFSRYFRLSSLSYTLITLFMVLHVIGSHYTYAEVPVGYLLQEWLGASRNMYDRLVHFLFGFLLAYPMREVFLRIAKSQGVWGYSLPVMMVLALSATYEIIEWLVAAIVDPSAGLAFLGTQGDIWDAQKDMLLAGVGALLTMLLVLIVHWRYNPDFGSEMRQSISIKKDDAPLGEVKLRELISKYRKR
jgi:putative membrane protein